MFGGWNEKILNEEIEFETMVRRLALLAVVYVIATGGYLLLYPSFDIATHNAGVMLGNRFNLGTIVRVYILAPVLEEYIFRHHMLRLLKCITKNKWIAIVIQASLFGSLHTISPLHSIGAFTIGVVLGYIMEEDRNLGQVVILHSLFNFTNII